MSPRYTYHPRLRIMHQSSRMRLVIGVGIVAALAFVKWAVSP